MPALPGPWTSGSAPGSFTRALIIVLAVWILHSFLEAMLAACVTAVASWPLYTRFANRMPARLRRTATPLIFTCLMIVFVLAPMVFAFGALLGEAHTLILEIAAADQRGIALPRWLESVPLVGPWAMARWQSELAHPGTLLSWAQRTDPALLLGWAQSLGQFTAHHAIIIAFAILLLFFLYQNGEVLAQGCRRVLRQRLGAGVERYIGLGTRAVRASVNSMLVVGLFDGLATAAAFTAGRRAAGSGLGSHHRVARARPLPRLRGRHRTGAAFGHQRRDRRGVHCAGARQRHSAGRRQGGAAGGCAGRGRSAFRLGAHGLPRRL